MLLNPNFALLWSGQTVSVMGSQVSTLAIPILVLALTGSAAQAGFVSGVRLVPYLVLSLPAGALVDRWDRRTTMIVANAVRGLALGTIPVAYVAGHLSIWMLYAVVLVEGTAFVFFTIAHVASLVRIVSARELAPATAMMEGSGSVATLIGPGVAGVIIGLAKTTAAGAVVGLAVDAVSYLASIASLLLIRVSLRVERTGRSIASLPGEIRDGMAFLFRHGHLRVLALLGLNLGLLVIPTDLAGIVLFRQQLHFSAATIGLIFSAGGLGAVAGSAVGAWFRARFRLSHVIYGTLLVQALSAAAMAVTASPLVFALGMLFETMMLPIYNISQSAYRLQLIPDAMQGRVNSVFRLIALGSQPAGLAAAGLVMNATGPRVVLWAIAGGFIAAGALVGLTRLRDA